MAFYQIPGQTKIVNSFRQLVDESRVPHSILIHERPGGSGLAIAIHLARMLLCENRQGGDPCDECPQCVKTMQHTHPDMHYVFPNNTNSRFKRAEQRFSDNFYPEWREALTQHPFLTLAEWYKRIDIEKKQGFIGDEDVTSVRKKLTLRAHGGRYRVFIIWHAEKMNHSFANKILKNLEEPTDKTVFILITSTPALLLPTIVSRVQIFKEEIISEEELAHFLVRQFDASENQARISANRSEGNLSKAIKHVFEEEEPWLKEFQVWMRLAYSRDLEGLLRWSDKMSKNTRDEQKYFCEEALIIIDRCYRMAWLNSEINSPGDEAKFFRDFSPFINTANAQGFLHLLEEATKDIQSNLNQKIVWFDSSIKAIRLIHSGKKTAAQNEEHS